MRDMALLGVLIYSYLNPAIAAGFGFLSNF
jgi:hypothetical protein